MKKYAAVFFFLFWLNLNLFAQTETLEVGKTLEKEIAGSQSHSYQIALKPNQFVHAVIMQKGVDVTVKFYEPTGNKIAEFDNPCGGNCAEIFHVITQPEGIYRLEIVPKVENAQVGKYTFLLDLVRDANSNDEARIKAEKALWFGQYSYNQQKAGGYEGGLAKLKEALDLYQQIGDTRGMSVTYEYFGNTYQVMGKFDLAVESYQKTLTITRENKNRAREALMLNKLGGLYTNFHYRQKAKESFAEAAAIYKEIGNTSQYLQNLNNLGIFYNGMGEQLKGIETYTEILKTVREQKISNPSLEISALLNLAAYTSRRNVEKADELDQEALKLAIKLNDRAVLGRVYFHLTNAAVNKGNFTQGIDHINKAMSLWTDDPKRAERQNHGNQTLGRIYLGQENYPLALEKFALARELLNENPYLQASATFGIGQVYFAQKNYPEALKYLNEALKVFTQFEDKARQIEVNLLLIQIDRYLGNLQSSLDNTEEILSYFEKRRAQFNNQEIRNTFFAGIQPAYQFHIEGLMQLHAKNPNGNYAALALQTNERARARSLLEQLTESRIDIKKGVDALLVAKEKDVAENLLAKTQFLSDLLLRRATVEEVNAVKKEIENIQFEYERVQEQIRQKSPALAAITQPVPLTLAEIQQQVLDEETILLEYSLGKDKSYLFVVTKESLQTFELPKRSEIEQKARAYFEALTARNKKIKFETAEEKQRRIEKADAEIANLGESLSQTIVAPANNLLNKKRLLIVADGILQYIPFASLPLKNNQPLIANHEIVSLPSASTLAVLRKEFNGRKFATKTLAVIADPVFDTTDERLKKSSNQMNVSAKNRGEDLDEAIERFAESDANVEPGLILFPDRYYAIALTHAVIK